MNILTLCNQSEAIEIMKKIKADKYLLICPKKIRRAQIPKHLTLGVNVCPPTLTSGKVVVFVD